MQADAGPNTGLIGDADGRARLVTPALVLDLDAFERNVGAMAAFCRAAGVGLRPHAKTHKSVAVARRQIAAGALGVCCATLGEAEAMVAGGIRGVLITSPVVVPAKLTRLAALNRVADGLMVVADHPDNVDALAAAAAEAGTRLRVLVDVDAGRHRTGVTSDEAALALARRIADTGALEFTGIQAYAGHFQHVEDHAERRALCDSFAARLWRLVERLGATGLAPAIVTGAGTGSHALDAAGDEKGRVFTELQAGSYIFMDVEYRAVALRSNDPMPFETALFVRASVVSANHDRIATVDAGLKCFATDGPLPEIAAGAPPGTTFQFMGDEHGALLLPEGAARPGLGAAVELITPHCDPTVNLHDHYHCVRGRQLVDIWPIEGRGRH